MLKVKGTIRGKPYGDIPRKFRSGPNRCQERALKVLSLQAILDRSGPQLKYMNSFARGMHGIKAVLDAR